MSPNFPDFCPLPPGLLSPCCKSQGGSFPLPAARIASLLADPEGALGAEPSLICLLCRPVPSMPLAQLPSPQKPQAGFHPGLEPCPLPRLRYQGHFSILLLSLHSHAAPCRCKQGVLYGNTCPSLALILQLLCLTPQSVFRQLPLFSPPQMASRRRHRELSGSTKVIPKASREMGKETRADCFQAIPCLLPDLAL